MSQPVRHDTALPDLGGPGRHVNRPTHPVGVQSVRRHRMCPSRGSSAAGGRGNPSYRPPVPLDPRLCGRDRDWARRGGFPGPARLCAQSALPRAIRRPVRRQPVHSAEPLGPFVILAPVIGALAITFLVTKFAPEAQGHGVPEVMDAIYYRGGVIRPIVAFVKSLASAIAIGSGAAVGREGPIIQIGSALGSTLGQIIRMPPGQRITLVAAGAGAGIAATFNTPIGGVMFAVELMMPEVSVRTFLPVAIATGTATFVGRLFFGSQPAFTVPPVVPLA